MQEQSNKAAEQSLVHSSSNCVDNYSLWWSSSGAPIAKSHYTNASAMNIDFLAHHANQMKKPGHQLPDQVSLSSRSSSQSHREVSGTRGSSLHAQSSSTQSGNDNSYEDQVEGHVKPHLSLGASEIVFQPPKIDNSQSILSVPYPYGDPFFGGILAAYGSHTTIHPQVVGVSSSVRVPLPLEPAEDGPIYVNPKQYNGILRRRQLRAKLEAQNKLIKERKPYLHESRHLHAKKRARGTGGRFLNSKDLEQNSKLSNCLDGSGSPSLQLGNRNPKKSETRNSSDVANFSEGHFMSFTGGLHPHNGRSIGDTGGLNFGGTRQQVPVMR